MKGLLLIVDNGDYAMDGRVCIIDKINIRCDYLIFHVGRILVLADIIHIAIVVCVIHIAILICCIHLSALYAIYLHNKKNYLNIPY